MAHILYGKGAGFGNIFHQESSKFIAAAIKGTPMPSRTFTGKGAIFLNVHRCSGDDA
jgi:hypothetical protein